MLRPEHMTKLSIIGPKTMEKKLVEKLHELKVVHIVDHVKDEMLDIGSPFENAEELSDLIIKLKAMISFIKISPKNFSKDVETYRKKKKKLKYNDVKRLILKLYNVFTKNVKKLKELDNEIKITKNQLEKIKILKKLGIDSKLLEEYSYLSYFVGYLNRTKALEKELSNITEDYTLHKTTYKNNNLVLLFVVKNKKEAVQKVLEKRNFTTIDFSNVIGVKSNFLNILYFEKKIRKLEKETNKLKKELEIFKYNWSKQIVIYEDFLSDEAEKAEAPLRFASTEKAFFIKSWLPTKKLEKTKNILNELTNKRILIQEEKITDEDDIPIKLRNPRAIKNFEFFMHLYSLPKYKELDPTFFVFLSFPLFFGFMLGDMGYGLVTLALFWFLKNKFPKARGFFNILIFASIATIFFGALFGEFFGEEVLFGYHLPHIISRAHQLNELLYISIAIGIVHVNIGLLIGFYNAIILHGFKKAVFEKLSWIILEIGIVLTLFNSLFVGVVVGAIAIIMLYLGEGFKGIIELPSLFSNILSYARLMAIGVASVQLAIVINEFAKEFFHHGGFMILAGILILIVGHVINIALGILAPFLHSLRLQYVEFFTKFFHGGGKDYVPFGLKE